MIKLKNIATRISAFLKDKNKKRTLQIFKDFLTLYRIKKELPLYYFAKFLYRKEVTNPSEYLSNTETKKLYQEYTSVEIKDTELIKNKLLFHQFQKKNNIPAPILIGFNKKINFNFQNQDYTINTFPELLSFFTNLLKQNKKESIFIKPFSDQGGKDCYILHHNTLKEQLQRLQSQLLNNSFVFQEVIPQHPKVNAINPGCINSIRFNSFINKEGNVEILSAFMRFGANGSVVDNGSSGGFYVPINLKTGRLKQEGKQLMRYGGNVFHQHPDTLYEFNNFSIPFFKEACELVCNASLLTPSFKMLGWDIAIGIQQPILIEANHMFSLFVADIVYGGYLKHPDFNNLLNKKEQ